jgi:hypothetical protein
LRVTSGDYCISISSGGLATFEWKYRNSNIPCKLESKYELQISKNPQFNDDGIVVDKIVSGISAACGATNKVIIYVFPASVKSTSLCQNLAQKCNYINYNTSYYWRVKVWDSSGKNSGWINSTSRYTYPWKHPGPAVIYSFPANNSPAEPVLFVDVSRCYNNDGTSYPCKNLTSGTCSAAPDYNGDGDRDCYKWVFGDNSIDAGNKGTSYIIGDATHIYRVPKTYPSSLQICDMIGCCSATANVYVGPNKAIDLPQWKEISPF